MKRCGKFLKGTATLLGGIALGGQCFNLVIQCAEHSRFWSIREARKEGQKAQRRDGRSIPKCRRIAIITGASSGLGREYARCLAAMRHKYGVNEIWLIARRSERLKRLAHYMELPTRVLALDLTKQEDLEHLQETLKQERKTGRFSVSMLINCAGMGKMGSSQKLGYKEELRMIDINDRAAVAVTDMVVPYMRPGSRIVEVCSVAAFQPIPFMNTYAASKAFLYNYARGLRVELMGRGISVTAVCPYWIHDTEFIQRAGGGQAVPFMSSKVDHIAKWSLWDIKRDRAVSTPSIVATGMYYIRNFIPKSVQGYLLAFLRVGEL